ncbi:MAG: recombinase RecX [Bacteroidia bacterium]|nr:MAG: recombinase RecX [Bacteroidia bacterium]
MDLQSIRKKIYQYCAYQERSENQVKEKLKNLGLNDEQKVHEFIEELKAEKFLNEERYLQSFVRGKFRNCQWGKQKIIYELSLQNFQESAILHALEEIQEDEYYQTLYQLAIKKLRSLQSDEQAYLKTQKYLYQKGFETELIEKVLKEIFKK